MKQKTYTMSLEPGGEVVAQGVPLGRALVLALEHGGPVRAALVDKDLGSVRRFDIGKRLADGRTFRRVMSVTVPHTSDPGIDVGLAIEKFEKTLLEDTSVFWPGRIESDEEYARRSTNRSGTRTRNGSRKNQENDTMTRQTTMLESYIPEFSGFLSEAWGPLLHGPAQRAAEIYASSQGTDRDLDRVDYLDAFAESGDFARQCATIARSYSDIFAIHLALKLGIPHGIRFERYDERSDRIVLTVPLPAVLFILNRCEEKRRRSFEGLKLSDFEPFRDFAMQLFAGTVAITEGKRLLEPAVVTTLLRAFSNPSIEKTAIRAIAHDQANLAFSESIDWNNWRAAVARRRREKYPRPSVNL